jgi:hypothetical protein
MSTQEPAETDTARSASARDAFGHIADRLLREPGLQAGTGFSTDPGLRSFGRLFAMLRDDALVVRLPAGRADELVQAGIASRFYDSAGPRLKPWVAVPYTRPQAWTEPAREALSYAREVS